MARQKMNEKEKLVARAREIMAERGFFTREQIEQLTGQGVQVLYRKVGEDRYDVMLIEPDGEDGCLST